MRKLSLAALLTLWLGSQTLPAQDTYRISTAAGQASAAGDNGPALSAQLAQPEGLAFDGLGNLLVTDSAANRLRRITRTGLIENALPAGIELRNPYGVVADRAGNLWIADLGNRRVLRVATAGEGGTTVAATVDGPRNLALDASSGTLYISDTVARRVWALSAAGLAAVEFTPAIESPTGVAISADGRQLYVADASTKTVRMLSSGQLTTVVDGLASPLGLALDPRDGTLWVADGSGDRLVRRTAAGAVSTIAVGMPVRDVAVDPSTGAVVFSRGRRVYRIAAGAESAAPEPIAGDDKPEPATTLRLTSPIGIAVESSGALLIAEESAARVRRFPAGSSRSAEPAVLPVTVADPVSVAADALQGIRIADYSGHRIHGITPAGVVYVAAGDGEAGFRGDNGPATTARLNRPRGIAFDPQGNLYIADSGNHRIRRIGRNGIITTVAGSGVPGSTGDNGPAAQAQLNAPQGVWVDAASGALYIADTSNNAIRRVTADGMMETAVPSGTLNAPAAVALDAPSGDILIADTFHHCVRRLRRDRGILETIAGTGAAGFSGDDGPALEARLNSPSALALDGAGNILVADLGNARVRKLTPVAAAAAGEGGAPIQSPRDAPLPPGETISLDVRHAATLQPGGAIAPGQIVTLFGAFPEGAIARFDGVAAPVLYAGPAQWNVQAPFSIAGRPAAHVELVSPQQGRTIAAAQVAVAAVAPGLFTESPGNAAALNEDGSVNSAANPAPRGSIVTLHATGEGSPTPAAAAVSVRVGASQAEVLSADTAPGSPGLFKVRIRLPGIFTPPGARLVTLTVGGADSQPGVSLHLK